MVVVSSHEDVLDTSWVTRTEPGGALFGSVTVQIAGRSLILPGSEAELGELVRTTYLLGGEASVKAVFAALITEIRRSRAEISGIEEIQKFFAEHPDFPRYESQSSGDERKRSARNLVKRAERLRLLFHLSWEALVAEEGILLRWYEGKLMGTARAIAQDRLNLLGSQWRNTYKITLKSGLAVNLEDAKASAESYQMTDDKNCRAVVNAAFKVALLWEGYCSKLLGARQMSKKDFHGNREALANLRKEVDNLYRKFKEALKIAGANHPIVHTVCRKLKGVMTREESLLGRMQSRLSELSEQRRRQVEVKLIAAFIEAAEANATTLVEFEQARVFASYMASLEDDVEYGEDALVRSTASLIAERIADTGNNLKSMWVQQPLHLRIDAAVRPATAGAAAYGMQIGASEASYFSQLPPSNRELLRLFAATGALAARARNEVVQLIKRKVESDEAFLQKILMGVNLVALGLVPFTEGVSLAVAGAIDAAFALREAKIALNQYTTQSDLAKIALTAVEDMYWKVPHLTDLTEKLVTLTLQIFGDVITTGAASHLIDALSIAYTIAS